MENKENIKREYKLVFNSGVARRLLKMGVNIADIKADKNNPDKTVFVFKRTDEFEEAFAQINREIAETKAADIVL
jgi:hypothetical protein